MKKIVMCLFFLVTISQEVKAQVVTKEKFLEIIEKRKISSLSIHPQTSLIFNCVIDRDAKQGYCFAVGNRRDYQKGDSVLIWGRSFKQNPNPPPTKKDFEEADKQGIWLCYFPEIYGDDFKIKFSAEEYQTKILALLQRRYKY